MPFFLEKGNCERHVFLKIKKIEFPLIVSPPQIQVLLSKYTFLNKDIVFTKLNNRFKVVAGIQIMVYRSRANCSYCMYYCALLGYQSES